MPGDGAGEGAASNAVTPTKKTPKQPKKATPKRITHLDVLLGEGGTTPFAGCGDEDMVQIAASELQIYRDSGVWNALWSTRRDGGSNLTLKTFILRHGAPADAAKLEGLKHVSEAVQLFHDGAEPADLSSPLRAAFHRLTDTGIFLALLDRLFSLRLRTSCQFNVNSEMVIAALPTKLFEDLPTYKTSALRGDVDAALARSRETTVVRLWDGVTTNHLEFSSLQDVLQGGAVFVAEHLEVGTSDLGALTASMAPAIAATVAVCLAKRHVPLPINTAEGPGKGLRQLFSARPQPTEILRQLHAVPVEGQTYRGRVFTEAQKGRVSALSVLIHKPVSEGGGGGKIPSINSFGSADRDLRIALIDASGLSTERVKSLMQTRKSDPVISDSSSDSSGAQRESEPDSDGSVGGGGDGD